jgi:serine/threonine protein kinase
MDQILLLRGVWGSALAMARQAVKVTNFGFEPGQRIGDKYHVEAFLGGGLQGEVYRVTELQTRVRRAAKLFYPQQNQGGRTARNYAQRLDRLRDCPIVIQYHHAETVRLGGIDVTCLLSEYVNGMLLSDFIAKHPGARLPAFKALHVLYPLVCGLEQIHRHGEYHGDIHAWNILIRPRGVFFDLKLIDFYNYGRSTAQHRRDDIIDVVRLLYAMVGDRRRYRRQPPAIKAICRGMQRGLILESFPTASHLRRHLETFPELCVV